MPATPQKNAALVRRFLADVVDGGDTAAIGAFLREGAVDHHLVFGEADDGAMALGWRVLAAADIAVNIETVVAADDAVAVRATVTGTHRESLMDLAPTGASFEIACAWFCRIDDERIAEIWSLPDGLGLLRQLGALSVPAESPPTKHRHP